MTITILGTATDVRTDTSVVYTQMGIPEYLRIVGSDFENFHLQRRREDHKAYGRLAADIRDGALLPSITLAVKPDIVPSILPAYEAYKTNPHDPAALAAALEEPGNVDILDGLQRTYIMNDLAAEGVQFKDGQRILVEFWLEQDLHNLIYRIIVLNAGQKPMSIRHQLELLFGSLHASIMGRIPNLEIYRERDGARRSRPRKFAFNVVVSAYQALLMASAELQKDNIIATRLMESNALDLNEAALSEQFERFISALSIYADLDADAFRIYRPHNGDGPDAGHLPDTAEELSTANPNWLATENVMVAYFAAIAQFSTPEQRRHRTDEALQRLKETLKEAQPGSDPLGLIVFDQLRSGIVPRKTNVGVATRRLLTNGFKEYFREAGELPLGQCWTLAVE